MLNEFLKEHRQVEQLKCKVQEQERKVHGQEATIAQQRNEFQVKLTQQQQQIEALTAGLKKVSRQVEMNKPAPQVATQR